MRIAVIVLFVLLILYLIFKPLIESEKPSKVLIIIVLLPTLGLSWGEYQWQSKEIIGTEIVKYVSGKEEGTLHCQRFSEAFFDPSVATKGMVYYADSTVAVVKYETCQDLFAWLGSNKENITLMQVQALGVLTHESVHVSGEFNEAITECMAMKKLPSVAMKLGVNELMAETITKLYREQIHVNMPAQYQGGVC